MSIPGRVEIILQKMMSVINGKEMRPLIHDAFECLYEDAGNLEEANTQAAIKADVATAKANIATDQANSATSNANSAATNAAETRQDVLRRLADGEFKGDKGDKGDKGEQGISGVTAPASGMFSLYLDPATGELYADYPDGETPPTFEFNAVTGELYYVTG